MNISGWVQLQFDCKCFKFSCLKVCWKFQSMLKSVMHVESILKKSVENYKKACWNFQHVLKTVKKHVEISVCSENCKKACWKFQNVLKTVMHVVCLKFQCMLQTVIHGQPLCWMLKTWSSFQVHAENYNVCTSTICWNCTLKPSSIFSKSVTHVESQMIE